VPLLCVTYLSQDRFGNALRSAAEEDLEHLVGNIYSMCKVQHEMVQMRVISALNIAREKLYREDHKSQIVPGENVHFDAINPMTNQKHIKTKNDEVLGALSVSEKDETPRSFKDEIKNIKVGHTGYVYIIDSKGMLKVHPAKEGENILNSKDSTGFEYIRAMVTDALELGNGEVGTIRYPWVNPELGEKRPRQKISKYIYFKPWDWIIAAGSYEEEIYQSLYETERFILIAVIVSLALVLFLTFTLAKVLTRPIQDLTQITTKMVDGDLSQRVKVRSADEIGALGTSFNQMISQLQDHTTILEKMVEDRTRELEESREKYRDLSGFLNNILDSATEYAIMAVDFFGKITEFNRGAEKLFGWKKDEVLNKENIGITILLEDRDRGIQKEISKRTRTKGVCDLEMDRVRRNGDRFPAHSTVTAIKDSTGKMTGFVEIVRDITPRKTLERELRETKEFLENIMESSVDGIVTTDLKGKVTYLNRAMEEIIQFRRDEVLGVHISRFYVKGIQEARHIMDLLWKSEKAENYEMELKSKAGNVIAIVTSIFLLRDGDNRVIGTAGIFKNITEQQRLEAELKAAQANLVEASKMRALGELVAGVAHELNNPLMASQTILHVIFNNLHENCPNKERLELIRRCNDRIQKIVEHLREFSRQEKPEFQKLDINQPIENALLITGQQLLDHNISVVKRLAEDLPEILGDSNQLEQVFLNLITNAMDAMDLVEGQKQLTIGSELGKYKMLSSVAVSIKDTGAGIPPENLDKVFEPFFSTKPVGRGTGLGLSLSFGIIEAHRGKLEIKSQTGKGTEVTVILPVEISEKE
jgi:PAS domain S-box-containing protein